MSWHQICTSHISSFVFPKRQAIRTTAQHFMLLNICCCLVTYVCPQKKTKVSRPSRPRGLCVELNDVTCCLHRNLSELPKTYLVNVDSTLAEPSLSDEGDRPLCLLLKVSKLHWKKGTVGLNQPDFTFKPSISWGGLLVTCFIVHTDTEYTCTDDTYTHTYTNLLKHRRAHARWHTCMHARSHNFMKTNKAHPVDRISLKLHDGKL